MTKKNSKKAKANESIQVPKKVLSDALGFGSLYGSTTTDRTKHAQIPTIKLIFEDGQVSAYGKRKDSLCVFHFKFFDDEIKGKGDIYIGDVIKLIGGRDLNKNTFNGVIKRLNDLINIDIVTNQVMFDKDKDFDVSISLIDAKTVKDYVIEASDFPKKLVFEDGEIKKAFNKAPD